MSEELRTRRSRILWTCLGSSGPFEEILAAVGENPDREGLLETPGRVARMYARSCLPVCISIPLGTCKRVFSEEYDELVLVRDISFNSMCEHHLLPFIGKALTSAICRRGKVVGLSKLARIVDEISRQPQVQERMTHQIADLMNNELEAKGVVVVLEAEHSCMTIRGSVSPGRRTVTSAVRGAFQVESIESGGGDVLINRSN